MAETNPGDNLVTTPLAHTAEDGRRQPLIEHLTATAERAAEFAREFGCSEWGYLAGLWHDLGKYSPDFQRYIRTAADSEAHIEGSKPGRVDHSTAGALPLPKWRSPQTVHRASTANMIGVFRSQLWGKAMGLNLTHFVPPTQPITNPVLFRYSLPSAVCYATK